MRLSSTVLEEPSLIFGSRGEEKDPRLGLSEFGPWFASDERRPLPSQVRIGIVGTSVTLDLTRRLVEELQKPIESGHFNKWAHPDFDGFTTQNRIGCEFVLSDSWNAGLTPQECRQALDVRDPNERIATAAALFIEKLKLIATEESPPDVVVFALPQEIVDYCGIGDRTRGAKRPRFSEHDRVVAELKEKHQRFLEEWGLEVMSEEPPEPERDYDLRNSIKGKAMQVGIPVQIVKEHNLRAFLSGEGEKDGSLIRSSFAWNFSTGLYYKARGRPWRLAKLTPGTCYVGVSFYRDLRNPKLNLETSMAQVFTHSGDGFVLRGEEVVLDSGTKEAHLTRDQSRELLRGVLRKFREKTRSPPARVVLHKTSRFSAEEREGFLEALGQTSYDFVAITRDSPLRLLRLGEFPVLRGTMCRLADTEFILYTTGYVPRLRTYPGRSVPDPLRVKHEGTSESKLLASEILGLTKLNWNTTTFATRMPITLEFARQVGKVLSELGPEGTLQDHYRFYM